jgi:N-acetylmuramoyl-L-alanine amidase
MSRIKIAVDAGHGFNTAGKWTSPMPQDIDFENDGVIDVEKGTAIREHIANVGGSNATGQ